MEESGDRADNPYVAMEGYTVLDTSGSRIGEIEDTVYDAPSDVLKYVIVDGRPIPAEDITVDGHEESVTVPFDKETVDSAPELHNISGAFDDAVHEHYGDRT